MSTVKEKKEVREKVLVLLGVCTSLELLNYAKSVFQELIPIQEKRINEVIAEFPELIIDLRNYKKGKTVQEMAEDIKVSSKTITYWEKGLSVPNITNLKKLANYFEVEYDYLYNYYERYYRSHFVNKKFVKTPRETRQFKVNTERRRRKGLEVKKK